METLGFVLLSEHLCGGDLHKRRGDAGGGGLCGGRRAGSSSRNLGIGDSHVLLGPRPPVGFGRGFILIFRRARFSTFLVGSDGVEVRGGEASMNVRRGSAGADDLPLG